MSLLVKKLKAPEAVKCFASVTFQYAFVPALISLRASGGLVNFPYCKYRVPLQLLLFYLVTEKLQSGLWISKVIKVAISLRYGFGN